MYVYFGQRRTARDEQGKPIQDEEGGRSWRGSSGTGRSSSSTTFFNVEQTEGLELRPFQNAPGPEQEGHERAEALIAAAGPQITRGPAEVLPELTFVLEAGLAVGSVIRTIGRQSRALPSRTASRRRDRTGGARRAGRQAGARPGRRPWA